MSGRDCAFFWRQDRRSSRWSAALAVLANLGLLILAPSSSFRTGDGPRTDCKKMQKMKTKMETGTKDQDKQLEKVV